MTHDPQACGFVRQTVDTDGYRYVVRKACVHGFAVTETMGGDWTPRESTLPECAICERRITRPLTSQYEGKPAHAHCLRTLWPAATCKRFVAEWNQLVPRDTLKLRYHLGDEGMGVRVAWLKRQGYELRDRRTVFSGHKTVPTAQMRQEHEVVMSGGNQ